jgi:drug/metabolite transporter (DMT)-like permease
MPYYIYAWIGAFVSGLFVITAKLTSKYSIENPWLFNFALIIATLVFMFPIALLNHAGMPTNWLLIICTAIFSTLFNIFWILATYVLDVSVLAPLFNFRGVFVLLLGATFLNEKFTGVQFIYILVIIMAGVFSSMDEHFKLNSFLKKSVALALLASLFLAIYNVFLKPTINANGLWTTNLWVTVLNCVLLIPTLPKFHNDIKKLNFTHLAPVILLGIFNVITEYTANSAYASNVVITSLIMNIPFSMIIAFIFSIYLPKLLEKHSLKIYAIRFTSTAAMIYCAMQLSK